MSFLSVSLQPGYGTRTCAITWNVPAELQRGTVFIYRSMTGLGPWTIVNDKKHGTPASVGYFVDRVDAFIESTLMTMHYRLLLEVEKEKFDSPIVNLRTHLTPREYGIVKDIMFLELKNMRSGNGVPAFIFAPLRRGIPAPGFDFETNQMQGTGMTVPGQESYGEAFVGGYGPPAITWVMKMGAMTTAFTKSPDGNGSQESTEVSARLLAFPRPVSNYMIVLPLMDERYAVGEIIKPFMFKGMLPIGYEVRLNPIPRTDARYKVPVPPMPEEMYRAL